MNNPTTRRYSRTLSDAFGPYTNRHIEDASTSYPLGFMAALYAIAAVTLAIIWFTR